MVPAHDIVDKDRTRCGRHGSESMAHLGRKGAYHHVQPLVHCEVILLALVFRSGELYTDTARVESYDSAAS